MLLVHSPKDYLKDRKTWKKENEWRTSKLLHYWDWPEYREESWRLQETCCHSKFRERPSANTDVKQSHGVNNNNNNHNAMQTENYDELKKIFTIFIQVGPKVCKQTMLPRDIWALFSNLAVYLLKNHELPNYDMQRRYQLYLFKFGTRLH